MKKNFIQDYLSAGLAGKLTAPLATLLVAAGLATAPLGARAQLVLTSAIPTTENFDGLGTSATATAPSGIRLSGEAAPTYGSANNYTATTVVANGNNFTAGGTYNFAAAAGSTDRALGFLNSGSYGTPRSIMLQVNNGTGAVIQDLSVQFNLEKYRSGTREYNWTFYTSLDGVTWTAQADGAQNYPGDATNTVYSYPPLTTAKAVTLTGVSLANGAAYYLRWTQMGVGGSTNGQGAGLDDVTLTPTLAGGTTPTPTASISTGAVAPTSYCVTSTAGSALSVPFTSTGTAGTYSVQLSDAAGVFPASTTAGIIGSGTTSPIAATIPAGTASGSGYRVRVLSDTPATTGTDNGTNLTVSQAPASNPVTVAPGAAQTVTSTGTGATLMASTGATATYAWQYGTSAGGPYTALAGATGATYQVRGADLPGAGTYYLVAQATTTSTCGSLTTTSTPVTVTVTAAPTPPALAVSVSSLPSFGNVAVGAASLLQSFTVGGNGLTGPITITPPAGFEIRTGATAFACCAIVLTPTNGTVPSTTIEVRFVPTMSQAYAATIPVVTPGQPDQAVAVSGTGIDAVYPATLRTAPITALTPTTATSGGSILTDGGSPVTARGVVWGKTANPVLGTNRTVDGNGPGDFSSAITGLLPGTTYFVRAYATNGLGTSYGDELSFATVAVAMADEPTNPATITASQVTGTTLVLNLGGGPSQKYLVLAHLGAAVDATPTDATTYTADPAFGAGQQLGTGNYVVYNGTGSQVTITGLRPSSPYYFTVFAFNDNNTPYAENYLTTTPGTLAQTTQALPAALLLEENFEYPVGALLTANNWNAHSGAGTKSITVVAPSLSYAGYGPNSGNAAALTGSGEDVNRSFAPVYARTPVYASFLVNVSSVTTTGDYFFHLGPQAIGSTYRARVFVRKDASGKLQFGISGGTGTASYTPADYDLGATILVVVKYTFDETGNTSQLFINPTTDTEPATATATQTETGSTPAAPNDNIGSVALRQGTTSPVLVVDGIRVGTTFQVVKTGVTCLAPVLTVPTVATATAGYGQSSASVSFAATATGTPAPAITYSVVTSGTTTAITSPYSFPVGTTTVTATAANSCGTTSKTFAVTVQGTSRSITVLYQNGNGNPTNSSIDPFLQLVNTTSAAIPYQELTLRYYLTVENFSPIQATIGYAQLGTSGVQARYVALPQPAQGALGYIEYSFTSPKLLEAGANSGGILSHINKQNYSAFNETDDYSYNTNTTYAATDRITVYRNGTLVGGIEPAPMTAVVQLQAQSANQTTEDSRNTIDVVAQVDNLSTLAVPYQDLTVRYWFTPDGTSPVQGGVGYAQLGTSAVSLTFGQAGTQPYAELHFAASLGSLAPLGNSGRIILHLNKQNYSNFTQTNDYSFRPDNMLAANLHVTVYQQGQLVYGQEPAGAQVATSSARAAAPTTDDGGPTAQLNLTPVFEAFPNPFVEQTELHFRAATSGPARLVVYNALGQVVKTFFDGPAEAGRDYRFSVQGASLGAGVYLGSLQLDGRVQTVRLLLTR
ncbi:T9SS type A sorting domain-containing protein [Hymenobacter sp. UV11]|uniref:cellulose binding domain-containing protein n=1 Tax=Hymenobacter sp. UV11 TaxID=1849735 RepID=UPI00105D8AF7|nr:cellulose binding domain-containing protein [Hymenobacter sp. UV11]TDN39301.1 hypothetical protein A8B98_18755 [Hymenobacter sp. UV11]TFZ65619.1 T9SS type A sorting domain-containing protein [Hymenobacter sp. UV11]